MCFQWFSKSGQKRKTMSRFFLKKKVKKAEFLENMWFWLLKPHIFQKFSFFYLFFKKKTVTFFFVFSLISRTSTVLRKKLKMCISECETCGRKCTIVGTVVLSLGGGRLNTKGGSLLVFNIASSFIGTWSLILEIVFQLYHHGHDDTLVAIFSFLFFLFHMGLLLFLHHFYLCPK